MKRTFQKGAALALAALWFPVAFLALAETPKEALDRLKEEKNRLEEQIEQAREEKKKKSKLFSMLGLFFGTGVALLIC